MQEVKAIIRPDRLDAVLHALHAMPDLPGVTVSEVRGIGRRVQPRIHDSPFAETLMIKLEIVIADGLLESVLRAIETLGRTGRAGDGKLFVYPVAHARRIRTGERDDAAL
jgi:nitrogen regulatory protein P-II 1